MKILEQFGAGYLDNLLLKIFRHCCGRPCFACFYGDDMYFSSQGEVCCPTRHIVAEKLGLEAKDIRTPASWGFLVEKLSDELPPSIKDLKAAEIKDPEHVKSLVVWE